MKAIIPIILAKVSHKVQLQRHNKSRKRKKIKKSTMHDGAALAIPRSKTT